MGDLLNLAMEAHGGLDRWRAVKSINLKLSIGGVLWKIKGQPKGLHGVSLSITPHTPSVAISPFDGAGRTGYFEPDRVWIQQSVNNEVIDTLPAPRDSFSDHEQTTQWSKLQELYFTGYALWNYLSTPFLLAEAGFETREIGLHEENGEIWRRLRVRYPAHIPTHCAEQTFYFADDGLLRRVDYAPDIVRGQGVSHYCYDHVKFAGISVPTLRRVVPRVEQKPQLMGPTIVLLQLSDVELA